MVSDFISRQAAIDDFYKYPNVKWTTLDVLEHINALPSAKPDPEWIPCSERLPKYGIDVLTVDRYGEYEINHIIDEEDGEWYWEKPIAWMPMPEPYKGGSDMRKEVTK